MRFTKIVATIGPATQSIESLLSLAKLGVNVCRMNFSHGDHAFHLQTIKNVRSVQKKGYPLALMLDTKGPEIRTGDTRDPIKIEKGDLVLFSVKEVKSSKYKTLRVNYDKFSHDVKHARSIVIDNGSIEMKLVKVENGNVIAEALQAGTITSKRHINLPGAHISLPSFTDKDWADILFGIEYGVDFIAPSFIRTGKDVKQLRDFLIKHRSDIHIFSKIETPQAVDNIDDIIAYSDQIMIARGDLGSEVPFEDVPSIQVSIVEKCRRASKPVLVATHMLESMINSPSPTRAEATDIAFAALLQADATMLSGETAGGKYPQQAVEAMARILERNEKIQSNFAVHDDDLKSKKAVSIDLPRKEQASAACLLAKKLHADALVVISKHGKTANAVSNCRPILPIFAFTATENSMRKLLVTWGVFPECIKFSEHSERTVASAMAILKKKSRIKPKQRVVVVSDVDTTDGHSLSIQVRVVR